jgi:hypothetical protein
MLSRPPPGAMPSERSDVGMPPLRESMPPVAA